MNNAQYVAAGILCLTLGCATGHAQNTPAVSAPPESFFSLIPERDQDAARKFYKKYVQVDGMPVAAAGEVSDVALQRTYSIVSHMLAGRPDLIDAMVKDRMYLIIIGKDQVYTDMPEYSHSRNPEYQNERVRGTGGRPTSFGEENLLSLPLDRYDDESIAVHEFCHTIDSALRRVDSTWTQRKNAAYQNARAQGLFKDTYAISNPGEYWAEIAQAYFDCNRINNWNHGPIGTREQLKAYDPKGYELVRAAFNLQPHQDWRYSFLQKLPNVQLPPKRIKADPFYTKFTWAREFTVLGRQASDESLLKANDIIRKMFAYRHDILKMFINDGYKLVILGRQEKISELPEHASLKGISGFDPLCRYLDYLPGSKLFIVPEENILANPRNPNVGDCQVIRVFAKAIYLVAANRPVDPDWEKRPAGIWQQYELRVKRLDVSFAERVQELYRKSIDAGKWKGTSAVQDPASYWAAGVLAYFDASGQDGAPHDAAHPINTRESLSSYDAGLFSLVSETMAYTGKVDWRFKL